LPRGRRGCFNAFVLQQQTLSRLVSYSGTGLHSGNRVTMAFLPAPPDSGIRFRRMDLEGKPEIEARVENVFETNRSTTLAKGKHADSYGGACAGDVCRIRNRQRYHRIGRERAADSRWERAEYCKLVQDAGIEAQDARREPYVVTAPIELAMGDTVMTLFPYDGFQDQLHQRRQAGPVHAILQRRGFAQDLGEGTGSCAHVLFFRGDRVFDQEWIDPRRNLENAVVIRDDAC